MGICCLFADYQALELSQETRQTFYLCGSYSLDWSGERVGRTVLDRIGKTLLISGIRKRYHGHDMSAMRRLPRGGMIQADGAMCAKPGGGEFLTSLKKSNVVKKASVY